MFSLRKISGCSVKFDASAQPLDVTLILYLISSTPSSFPRYQGYLNFRFGFTFAFMVLWSVYLELTGAVANAMSTGYLWTGLRYTVFPCVKKYLLLRFQEYVLFALLM